jgi:hypothetical protein
MKCYFINCKNTNCTTEVVTGVGIGDGSKHWNPVCDDCIRKVNWHTLEKRAITPRPVDSGTRTSNSGCEGSIPSRGSNMQEEKVTVGSFDLGPMTEKAATLYGISGGQLEFMSMRTTTLKVDGIWRKYVIMVFTDHDLNALLEHDLRAAGLKPTYEFMFPIE